MIRRPSVDMQLVKIKAPTTWTFIGKCDCEAFHLCCQPLKRQRIGSNHMPQGVNKQVGTLPAVEAEGHFVQVGLQRLCAYPVPRSDDSPLEQGERGFDCVGVNV